jgi:hypothetical protein
MPRRKAISLTSSDLLKPPSTYPFRNCLALQPGNLGDEIVGRETAVMMWKGLLSDRVFRGIVIEDGSARSGSRIIGVGAGVFVRPDFMTAEIGNPRGLWPAWPTARLSFSSTNRWVLPMLETGWISSV